MNCKLKKERLVYLYEGFKEIRAVQEKIGHVFFYALEKVENDKKGILGAIVIPLCTECVHKLNAVTTKAENNFQIPGCEI